MLVESHKVRLRESLRHIASAIADGPAENQRTIGFHASAAAVDLLNIYLHQTGRLDLSADISHRKLRSKRLLEEAMPYDFPDKETLCDLLIRIETARDGLCYGRLQDEAIVENTLKAFGDVRAHFRAIGAHE